MISQFQKEHISEKYIYFKFQKKFFIMKMNNMKLDDNYVSRAWNKFVEINSLKWHKDLKYAF